MIETRANEILKSALGNDAKFREGQLEAIVSVVEKKRTLVVQKTGWGKSIVYFIAAKILRENGSGPAIIISPLLALMKNQVAAAVKMGISTVTINSDNRDEWEQIYTHLDEYDVIIVSPERLSNEQFLSHLAYVKNIELFVVDEAHSISDWGHDFRPDYQRIVKLLDNFPDDIAVLGTTATANDRVIRDIQNQLGKELVVVRGNLIRENLAIQVNPIQSREERLSWLAQNLSQNGFLKEGQGIIYCLTQSDCETVTMFLRKCNISVEAYHAGLGKDDNGIDIAQTRLNKFDRGELRVLVSTVKLGMGYDKSDVRFVVHFQLPQNLIAYYQQIGRAGRDGNTSLAILLHGQEDEEILNYFIEGAQANPELLNEIMNMTRTGISLGDLLLRINIKQSKMQEALNYLMVHNHIYKEDRVYRRNIQSNFDEKYERKKRETLNTQRLVELDNLKEFAGIKTCYMKYISNELDAPDNRTNCGICANCKENLLISEKVDDSILRQARFFTKNEHGKITHRKRWANGKTISTERRINDGWVLSSRYYSEIGQEVKRGKYTTNSFSDELVTMTTVFLRELSIENDINLITSVSSLRRPTLVSNFAKKIAVNLGVGYAEAVIRTTEGSEQKMLLNSAHQQKNVDETTSIDERLIKGKRILLIDDMVDSGWSFTVIGSKLLESGAESVYPFALVRTGGSD